jgi:hypothetical protein
MQGRIHGSLPHLQRDLDQGFNPGATNPKICVAGTKKPASSRIPEAPPRTDVKKCAGSSFQNQKANAQMIAKIAAAEMRAEVHALFK